MKDRRTGPSRQNPAPRVTRKGDAPPCLQKGCQCRGCFGWQNMLRAAESDPRWRRYPLCCPITGLTIEY
jgi:hypothetical protein